MPCPVFIGIIIQLLECPKVLIVIIVFLFLKLHLTGEAVSGPHAAYEHLIGSVHGYAADCGNNIALLIHLSYYLLSAIMDVNTLFCGLAVQANTAYGVPTFLQVRGYALDTRYGAVELVVVEGDGKAT